MCRVLNLAPSTYYTWRGRAPSRRTEANAQLVCEMQTIHRERRESYGSPRMHRELCARGFHCNRKRVERLMRRHGLRGKCPGRRKRLTTQQDPTLPVAPNLLQRDFSAEQPNQKWVSDITYIETADGWLYLATVMDLYSRKIIGWNMDTTLATSLVTTALHGAFKTRKPAPGLIVHSDRGSQYASHACRNMLTAHGAQASMSRTGNCYDNAVMESFFATLKTEVADQPFASHRDAKTELFLYIEGFYNRARRHSTISYMSPDAYEQLFFTGGV